MIELTRINGNPIVLNSDLIKTAEASPDTMLTLINGEKMIVREACSVVIERVLAYRAALLASVVRLQSIDNSLPDIAAITRVEMATRDSSSSSRTCCNRNDATKQDKDL